MIIANLQIGLFGANGIFIKSSNPNSSIYEVPIFPKHNFCLVPGYQGVRKSSVFLFRKPKFGFINALPAEETETCSTSSSLLEKEFKFSPTFDEYVKVLESVKTDRVRVINEKGDFHAPKSKSVSVPKAESVRKKVNLSRSKKLWIKDKFYSEENSAESEYAKQNPPNAKNYVAEKSGSSWAVVENFLKKKAKEKSAEQRRGYLEMVSEDLNSAKRIRKVLYKKTKGTGKKINNAIFEKKRMSQRPEEQKENWLKLQRLDKFEGSKVVKSEIGGSDYGKPQFTPHFKYLNGQRNGFDKKIDGAEKTVDDEFSENRMMSERRFQETKKYQKNLNLNETKNINHMGESNCRDYEKSNHHSKSRYGGYNDDIMFRKIQGSNFTEIFGKYESSKFDNMHAKEKPRSKMEPHGMEGNKHNHAINAQNFDLYIPTTENYPKNINRSNAKFNDSVKAEKHNSRALIASGRSARTDVAYPDFSWGEMDGDGLEDRAAFKTFEVFTDVRNRPRVLRMEMEERIRNLAKWLNASDLNMPEWQFSKMIHSAKIKFSEHSILRIVQILGSFRNWRRVLQVIEWFHSRERFKYYKSRYIYTTALDVLGKAKRPIEALNIFYAMRQELSSYPDLAAYHCIAVTLGQAGLMKELFDVIDCMRAAPAKKFDLGPLQKWDPCLNPDIVIYNAVLNACVQQKQWEGAFWVLQELKGRGIRPSTTTYGLIMEVMLECGKYNLVYEFFWKLQKNSIPGALNYKVLINTLWREGKAEEAVQAVKDMEKRGIVGCASLYYDLARCLCSSGRCEEALHQVNKICKVAKKPLVVTYTGLIQACLDSGNIENATYIFNQMKSFCSPNVITCNIMLKAYVQHGRFDDAKVLFEKILSDSHQIREKDESYQKVLPDKFTFNTMMEACIAASKWDDFVNFYQEMIHHGYHFDERRHMRLVFDAWRAGKKNILEITWNHLTGNGRPPPPAMIKELFCMKMEEDEPATAISFITIHRDMEIEAFSEKSWLRLLKRKVKHISNKTLARLLQELKRIVSESARPHPVHQNLLNACEEFTSRFGVKDTQSSCNPELIYK